MGTPKSWIKKTLEDLRIAMAGPNGLASDEIKSQIELDELVRAMQATCALINKEAGRTIIHEVSYLQPQKMICKFTFETPKVNYTMALVSLEDGPALVFSYHRRNPEVSRSIIQKVYQFLVRPRPPVTKHEIRVYPAIVNNTDLQEWFTYLLSGLRNSHKPLAKNDPLGRAG